MDLLNVYLLEEALPRNDIEGLDIIANSVEMMMVGGEHTPTMLDFKPHLVSDAHDVQQSDITLMGNFGITGLKEVSRVANFYRHQIIPHVTGGGNFFIMLAATLQAMVTADNCLMVEFPYGPPYSFPGRCNPSWLNRSRLMLMGA